MLWASSSLTPPPAPTSPATTTITVQEGLSLSLSLRLAYFFIPRTVWKDENYLIHEVFCSWYHPNCKWCGTSSQLKLLILISLSPLSLLSLSPQSVKGLNWTLSLWLPPHLFGPTFSSSFSPQWVTLGRRNEGSLCWETTAVKASLVERCRLVAFSSHARILGECSTIHPQLALFFFFFKVEIRSHTLIPLLVGSVHGGSASWDDCGRMYPDKLRVSSFPYRFPHYAWTAA